MAYRRIHIKGDWRHEEAIGSGAITPGMLLESTSTDLVKAHVTEGGRAERLVAIEDALQGRAVGTNYDSGDLVSFAVVEPGTEMAMLIASGEAGNIGDEVVSAGDGTLKLASSLASAALNLQVIGVLRETFTTLSANTLKAVRFK